MNYKYEKYNYINLLKITNMSSRLTPSEEIEINKRIRVDYDIIKRRIIMDKNNSVQIKKV